MRALLVNGAPGSGKTAVLLALGELLEERGEPYALVDLDWLAWVRPAPGSLSVQDVLAGNLRAVLPVYERAGVAWLVLARFARRAEVEALGRVLPGLVTAWLDVPHAELERRLRARDAGAELEEHLALAGEAEPVGALVANHARAPREVAAELLELA